MLTAGVVSPRRTVPTSIERPEYVDKPRPRPHVDGDVQTAETIEKMRIACRIAAGALQEAGKAIGPGVTTDEVDRVGHEYLCDHGAYPSTLGYKGFPKSLCTSVNECICHGIPDSRVLEDGDICNIDITAYIHGVHGDTNATFLAGDVDQESRLLVERTEESLRRAIKAVRPGRQVNVIGRVIESYAKALRVRRRHGLHRTWDQHDLPLRPGDPALRRPALRHGDGGGHDLHDRADADAGHQGLGHVGRRVDRGHEGQQAQRAVRAHHGGAAPTAPRSSPSLIRSSPPSPGCDPNVIRTGNLSSSYRVLWV